MTGNCDGTSRWPWLSVASTLVCAVCLSLPAASQEPGYETLFRAHLTELNSLFVVALKKGDFEEERKIKSQARIATIKYIESYLDAANGPTSEDVSRKLNDSFASLSGYPSFQTERQVVGTEPYAQVLTNSSSRRHLPEYVVGIQQNPVGTVIWGLVHSQRGYRLGAESCVDMDGYALHLLSLESYTRNEISFLAFGNRIGASYFPVRVVLYRFDGKSLRPLWHRDDLPDGAVTVQHGNSITLTYLDDTQRRKHSERPYIKEKYLPTRDGARLVSHELIAAP